MKSQEEKDLETQRKRNRISYLILSFNAGLASISDLAVSYFFKDELKLQPAQLGQIMSLIVLPFMVKPFFGLMTDLVPLFGYRRKSYIILCGIMNCLCWLLMAFKVSNLLQTSVCLFFIHIGLSFSTVLGEAIVVELSQLEKLSAMNNAKNYVSLFFLCKYTGVLLSSYLKGYLVDVIELRKIFLIASTFPCLMIISGFVLKETRFNNMKQEYQQIPQNDEEGHAENNSRSASEVKLKIGEVIKFLKRREVIVPIIFIIIFMSSPSYTKAFFYFLTNELKFKPRDLGKIAFCTTSATLIAITVYKFFFINSKFKRMITRGTILSVFFSFFAFLLVKRVNLTFGIPDFWLVLFASSFESMFGELIIMPMLSLAAILSPKHLEGTIYSIFITALNLGGLFSGLLGALLTQHFQITSDDYQNLTSLVLLDNVLRLVPLPMLLYISDKYFEIPSKVEEDSSGQKNEINI